MPNENSESFTTYWCNCIETIWNARLESPLAELLARTPERPPRTTAREHRTALQDASNHGLRPPRTYPTEQERRNLQERSTPVPEGFVCDLKVPSPMSMADRRLLAQEQQAEQAMQQQDEQSTPTQHVEWYAHTLNPPPTWLFWGDVAEDICKAKTQTEIRYPLARPITNKLPQQERINTMQIENTYTLPRLRNMIATTLGIDGRTAYLTYHSTVVFKIEPLEGGGKQITLNSGGWRTSTTKKRINDALRWLACRPWSVFAKGGTWYLNKGTETIPFEDGMKVQL